VVVSLCSGVLAKTGIPAVLGRRVRHRLVSVNIPLVLPGTKEFAETIAVAVAEQDGEVRTLGVIPNREEPIGKLVKKLGPVEQLRFCYEAGPTGYVVYWQLTALGAKCEVVAPTLVPVKSGERVKTDRRDALKLARNYRAGELTAVWVPDAAHEALRDLVRAREAAKKDQLRAKHRLGKFLLRHGRRPPSGVKPWTLNYLAWVKQSPRASWAVSTSLLLRSPNPAVRCALPRAQPHGDNPAR
jgi:transposase